MSAPSVTGESVEESVASGRLVVFRLADREYALPVEHVGEVIPMVALTPVPEAPGWIAGVLNLRGLVIPVLDLRARLGLAPREPELQTPIVIAREGERTAGLIVDEVLEVLAVPSSSMSAPDEQLGHAGPVEAVATLDERLILVLDVEPLTAGSARFVPVAV